MKMLRVIIIICGVLVRNSCQWVPGKENCRTVMTEAGWVRGCASDNDHEVMPFLGVPYAAPPTGHLRFKAPNPPLPWKGIYEADRVVKCPQDGEGVEDCLILNIFTPYKVNNRTLPVLAYIHGGSFIIGSGQVQGTEPLVKQNIIVVTVNYRLGALGFLCLGTKDAPGNAGMKDLVAALQWIQRNIVEFGGDPNQVTIYGMSAGGAAVELLVLSKQSRGLFQRAIVESASATSVWPTALNPLKTARNVGEMLDFPMQHISSEVLAQYYKRVSAAKLAQVNFDYYNSLIDGTFGFVPCVENTTLTNKSDAFLTDSPYNILRTEKYEKVPIMFLYSSLEGLNLRSKEYYQQNYKERMSADFLGFVPADLEFDSPEIKIAIADNINDFYFGNKTIGDDLIQYLNYFGDYLIMHGLLNSVEVHSRNQNPVYLMEFAYKGNLGNYDKFYDSINMAGHGDVVKHVILNKQPLTKEDKNAVLKMAKLIANFVMFGNPTPERSQILPILWPRVQPGNVSCLYLDDEFQVVEEPLWDRKIFWDHLYSKYRRTIKPVNPEEINFT